MSRALFVLAAIVALGVPDLASAQCSFNFSAKAGKMQTSMVRAFNSCPSIAFPSPTTSTKSGIPACAPPTPYSSFQFDAAKGGCKLSFKPKLLARCSDMDPNACSDTTIAVFCTGILDASSQPTTGAGWNLDVIWRETKNDSVSGDVTMIDFPAQFPLPSATSGVVKGKWSTRQVSEDLWGPGFHDLMAEPCLSVEIVTVELKDQMGNTFAVPGFSVH